MKVRHLKTNSVLFNPLTFVFLLMTLILTSCGPDGLTDPVNPIFTPQINTTESVSMNEITFEFGLHFSNEKSDCPVDQIQIESAEYVDYLPMYINGCYGPPTHESDPGRGWDLEYGRFVISGEFKVYPARNLFTGKFNMSFPPEDMLVFRISDEYEIQIAEDSTSTLIVDILDADGTGVFENIDFVGKLYMKDARQIFDKEITDYNVNIKIVGTMAN